MKKNNQNIQGEFLNEKFFKGKRKIVSNKANLKKELAVLKTFIAE